MLARLFALALLILGQPAWAEKVALVIGNSAYTHASILENPGNDATDMAEALSAVGFEVEVQLDLGQLALLRAFRDFKNRAAGAEMAVVYYAGHGIEIERSNYLVPVDATLQRDTDIPFESVPLEAAMQAVSGATRLSVVIVDACRNNPFRVSMTRSTGTRSLGRGLALVEPQGNTLVAYAAKEGTEALDGRGRNSPYAAALTSAIAEPGLEIGQLFRRVRDDVLTSTAGAQEPFVYGSLSAEAIYLNPPAAEPKPAPDLEFAVWNYVSQSDNPEDLRDYLERYPDGQFASFARRRLEAMTAPVAEESRLVLLDPPAKEPVAELPVVQAPVEPPVEEPVVVAPVVEEPVVVAPPFQPSPSDIRAVQARLNALGLAAGRVDGVMGNRTRGAIETFQRRVGLAVTGAIDGELVTRLDSEMVRQGVSLAPATPEPQQPAPQPQPAAPSRFIAVATGLYCEATGRNTKVQACFEITGVSNSNVTGRRVELLVRDGRKVPKQSQTFARNETGFGSVKVLNSRQIIFRNKRYDTRNARF